MAFQITCSLCFFYGTRKLTRKLKLDQTSKFQREIILLNFQSPCLGSIRVSGWHLAKNRERNITEIYHTISREKKKRFQAPTRQAPSSAPPSVKVPVLSLQITDAEPKVSTAAIFRTWPGTLTFTCQKQPGCLMVQWCLSEAEKYGVTRVNNHIKN